MRFRLALLIGAVFVVAGLVVMLPGDDVDGDVAAGPTSITSAGSTVTSDAEEPTTTTVSVESTTTMEIGESTTTSEAETITTTEDGETTTTTAQGTTTTTAAETTTTTSSGPDEVGPTVTNFVISDQDLTEWCEGDPEEIATLTISLQAEDQSAIEAVFVSWLVDLADGFADFVLDGDTWEARILFEAGTIFDILEPQPIDLTIVAEDGAGNFTFIGSTGPILTPQECS